jgi:hypothetical protein
MTERRLLFVYGNDSGAVNGFIHWVHKIVSPATYGCRLCALTYGHLGQRAAWAQALSTLGMASEFLHRDEAIARYGQGQPPFPAVFVVEPRGLTQLINKQEIESCGDLDALIALLLARCEPMLERSSAGSSVSRS